MNWPKWLPLGTRTLLFGVHSFWLHPFAVWLGWVRLFGVTWDYRLLACFIVHDWGYWGLTDLDGQEGKMHPLYGASLISRLFGLEWGEFCLLHSRHAARAIEKEESELCAADKMATHVLPVHLYLFLARLTGELDYYIEHSWRTLDHTDVIWRRSDVIVRMRERGMNTRRMEYAWVQTIRAIHASWALNWAHPGIATQEAHLLEAWSEGGQLVSPFVD